MVKLVAGPSRANTGTQLDLQHLSDDAGRGVVFTIEVPRTGVFGASDRFPLFRLSRCVPCIRRHDGAEVERARVSFERRELAQPGRPGGWQLVRKGSYLYLRVTYQLLSALMAGWAVWERACVHKRCRTAVRFGAVYSTSTTLHGDQSVFKHIECVI